MLIELFILLQAILLFFITFHDWIHYPPLTDIRALEKYNTKKSRLINSIFFFFIIFIPLLLTWIYKKNYPLWALISIVNFYGGLTIGTIFSWWVPYFFGSSKQHKANFAPYKNTHHFLPFNKDHITPNTFHVFLHLQIWTCCAIALYLLVTY